jgi:nicotinamide riboside transporter PnuC
MDLALQAILSMLGISGVWLTGEKNMVGWLLGILYNVLWIVYAIFTAQYLFIVVCLVYIWVYANAYMKWRKDAAYKPRHAKPVGKTIQVPLADEA